MTAGATSPPPPPLATPGAGELEGRLRGAGAATLTLTVVSPWKGQLHPLLVRFFLTSAPEPLRLTSSLSSFLFKFQREESDSRGLALAGPGDHLAVIFTQQPRAGPYPSVIHSEIHSFFHPCARHSPRGRGSSREETDGALPSRGRQSRRLFSPPLVSRSLSLPAW